MAKQASSTTARFIQYYPSLVAVVVVKSGDETTLMAAGWHTALSFAPALYAVSVSPKRHTYGLLKRAREFTVNWMPASSYELIAQVGSTSGREYDKIEQFGIKTDPSVVIKSPVLTDAYASYECKVQEIRRYGDHDLVVGEIVQWHIDSDWFSSTGQVDVVRGIPLYRGSTQWMTVEGDRAGYPTVDSSKWPRPNR